ncbi:MULTISPECIES: chemotaxis protein [Pseudomonas]|uniref:Chemotaxis protein CheW n=1 Tax=Pseudomonas kuykendallii TaxID=1007099 RepID=A0A2W5D043_9PSED|nr:MULTISPECIES: chemotaxis protein [Pseudomonas]PZP23094.1 MAG: chemotaxis protein CheW [Pseudomonas kuykendallii]
MSSSFAKSDALSLLLFTLRSGKLMAINLLKVSEIIPCPRLTHLPDSHPHVEGIATLRGVALSVINLSRAIGEQPLSDPAAGCLIVTQVSRSTQGLHVQGVTRIVHCRTSDIRPPPYGSGRKSFITGTAEVDGELIQILDIEKVIHGIAPAPIELGVDELDTEDAQLLSEARVLVVDDSQVALHQSLISLQHLGVVCHTAHSAREGMSILEALHGSEDAINIVVSDIEMPEMDGYSFTQSLRRHADFRDIYVLLHTSLDATMSASRATEAGANDVLTKFSAPELGKCLVRAVRANHAARIR